MNNIANGSGRRNGYKDITANVAGDKDTKCGDTDGASAIRPTLGVISPYQTGSRITSSVPGSDAEYDFHRHRSLISLLTKAAIQDSSHSHYLLYC